MMVLSPMTPNIVKKFGSKYVISGGLMITAAAFVIMSFWTREMTYWHLFGIMVLMMLGISAAMTPGTNTLIASVPRNRSGMSSAMNDTVRELGGALGVAVLGAILSAVYEDKIKAVASAFPEQIREGLESSLTVAIRITDKLGPAATDVANAAKDAFMSGMSQAALIAAVIIFVASLIALFGLPKHRGSDDTI